MIAPDAIQIIDLAHAKEHLTKLVDAIYGEQTDLSKRWASDQHINLEDGNMNDVLAAISCHTAKSGKVGEAATREFGYFNNNQDRMRYDYFRLQDLCVGSGVVEGGCKAVIGKRLKQSGMFWSLDGANAILALRCSMKSDERFNDFWQRYKINNYTIPVQVING